MDFSRFTEQQKACIKHLDGPLFIAAGAGSGKTFTLQNRIVWALMEESKSGIHSIDEVLAITFTEKATAEIMARVRSALREAGMVEEALKVDSAWISTIHGMCSRILREHALEARINPNFGILADSDAKALLEETIDEILAAEKDSEEYAALFAEYGVRATGFNDLAVFEMLKIILDKSASFSQGLDALDFGPNPPSARLIAERLQNCFRQASEYGNTLLNPKKTQNRLSEALSICDLALEKLAAFLAHNTSTENLAELMSQLKPIRMDAFGKKDPADFATLIREELDWALININASLARPHAKALLSLAHKASALYQAKLDELSVLDNNALLNRCLSMLIAHPEITARYTKRFKLVMIDEFQDTNQLQVDLIERVAGKARLCTVGDAQQSIYRFNGADVSVFEARRQAVQADKEAGSYVLESKLDQNFRSHKDILSFVRKICGSDSMFGTHFLDLQASRKEMKNSYRGSGPRVELQIVSYDGSKEATGAQLKEASVIAERFAQLRAEGHQAGEMVVLLSKTTHADVYAKALRAQGFECVLEGGKSFFDKEEVPVLVNLLAALANPADSKKLFAVLTSPLLHLSANDFLELGTYLDENGNLRSRRLERGIEMPVSETASPALQHAVQMLNRARTRINRTKPSHVIMNLLLDSGWLSRLESKGATGSAQAANILKVLRMIKELEQKPGYRIARIAREFTNMAKHTSESPASLAVSGQNAVRIMTIHKSKGLEFPIVAVADFEPKKSSCKHFSLTTHKGLIHLALSMKYNAAVCGSASINGSFSADHPSFTDDDPACYSRAITEHNWSEEIAEAQRKFYVASTRASEFLLVSALVKTKQSKNNEEEDIEKSYQELPILNKIRTALCGSLCNFPAENGYIDYEGSEPALFRHIWLSSENPFIAEEETCTNTNLIEVPVLEEAPHYSTSLLSIRKGVFSYSSIAPEEDHLPELERDDLSAASKAVIETLDETKAAFEVDAELSGEAARPASLATDVGTAFHRVAQLATNRLALTDGKLEQPPACAIDAISRSMHLDTTARRRLDIALKRWFNSKIARKVESFAHIRAEVPFMVSINFSGKETKLDENAALYFLEGEIDLLAESEDGRQAFVVDYKTGGSATESTERLQRKHRLQSICYAYALLSSQDYDRLEFAFVRVEQADPEMPQEPQIVRYVYTAENICMLKQSIAQAVNLCPTTP